MGRDQILGQCLVVGSTCSLLLPDCDKMPIYTALSPLCYLLPLAVVTALVLSAESRRYLKAMNLASIWDEDDRSLTEETATAKRGSGPFENVAS